MKRVVKLTTQSGDWEALFIDEQLISEGHYLGEGNSFTYLLELSERYNFKYIDVISHEINDEDEDYVSDCGNFPPFLTDLKGSYNEA